MRDNEISDYPGSKFSVEKAALVEDGFVFEWEVVKDGLGKAEAFALADSLKSHRHDPYVAVFVYFP
jgi:hypothetical protein